MNASRPPAARAETGDAPDISFVIATHNVAAYVEAAVQSALAQTGVRVEVVVVDDASTDDTVARVARLADGDRRVILVPLPLNGGPSRARNEAIARAGGRWIALLDGDDLILPERSRTLLELAAMSNADVVADNFERVDVLGRPTGHTMLATDDRAFAFRIDAAALLRGNCLFDRNARLGAMKPIIRADFLAAHAIRHDEDLRFAEDFLLCLHCLLAGARFVVSASSGYRYRMRPDSISWRIGLTEIETLASAFARIAFSPSEPGLATAAEGYRRSLEAARALACAVHAARLRHWPAAVRAVLREPRCWPLAARFGCEALANRVRLRLGAGRPRRGAEARGLGT